ncbi:MAG: hypothetical protein FWC96_08530 [Oscillospiraceae bacterium]|nr:hypothetical protein [Oscillospiraceae bacterium]
MKKNKKIISIVLCLVLVLISASAAIAYERYDVRSTVDHLHSLLEANGTEIQFIDVDSVPSDVYVIEFDSIEDYIEFLNFRLEQRFDFVDMEFDLDLSEFDFDVQSSGTYVTREVASIAVGGAYAVRLFISTRWSATQILSARAHVTTSASPPRSRHVPGGIGGIPVVTINPRNVFASAHGYIYSYFLFPGAGYFVRFRNPYNISGTFYVFDGR